VNTSVNNPQSDSSPLPPEQVTLTCSVDGGQPPFNYLINFGDGQTSNISFDSRSITAGHIYGLNAENELTATCIVVDENNRKGVSKTEVSLKGPSLNSVELEPEGPDSIDESLAAPRHVSLACKPSGGTPPFTYTWDFGDGTTRQISGISGPSTQSHSYTKFENSPYQPSCTVKDAVGDSRTVSLSRQIEVVKNTRPAIDELKSFPKQPTAGSTLDFISKTTGGNTSARSLQYNWDFGDGTTKTSQSSKTTHVYQTPGDYTVELSVTDSDGDTASKTTTVSVAEN
jgi:PKD repeat protein